MSFWLVYEYYDWRCFMYYIELKKEVLLLRECLVDLGVDRLSN